MTKARTKTSVSQLAAPDPLGGKLAIRSLHFENFRGYEQADFDFDDFNMLVGPNGIGKTTVLDAVTLLCSSLDFDAVDPAGHPALKFVKASGNERLKAFLNKNIRNIDHDPKAKSFLLSGVFERNGKQYEVALNQDGWVKNELLKQPWWWSGLSYFSQFDCTTATFQLDADLWCSFATAWEAITGFPATDPEQFTASNQMTTAELIIGFSIKKPTSKIHCRKGSAGERKIMKVLSMIVSMEKERQPDIVLIDNLEMHVASTRHLRVVNEVKKLFAGKQIIATTHSGPIIQSYRPRKHIIDIGVAVSTRKTAWDWFVNQFIY